MISSFGSKLPSCLANSEPIEPAPPVTKIVLFLNCSIIINRVRVATPCQGETTIAL